MNLGSLAVDEDAQMGSHWCQQLPERIVINFPYYVLFSIL